MKKLLWLAILCALFCLLPLSVNASTEEEQGYSKMVMKNYTGSWYHQSTYTYTYDRYGNTIQVSLAPGGNYVSGGRTTTTYEYTYNPDGTVRKMLTYKDDEYQSGSLYEYDEEGLLIRTSDLDTGHPKFIYVRDEFGNVIRQENYDSDGKLASYYESTYDGDVQLSQKICRKDGYVLSSMEYDPATGIRIQTSANSKTVTKYNLDKILREEHYQNDRLKSYTVYTYYDGYMIATSYDGIGTRTGYVKQEFDSNGNITLHASYNSLDEAMLYQTFAYTYPNHTHSWKVTESAPSTCSQEGYKKYKCTKCSETYTETVPFASHTYDDPFYCDADCNVCGAIREVEHMFSNDCDAFCNNCPYERMPQEHRYTNDCDPTCNSCGETRDVEHSYQLSNSTSQHWQECTVCGTKQTKEAHTYAHSCDADCEVCGYVRSEMSLIHSHTNRKWDKDETHHWRGCLNCGKPQNGNKYPHKFDSESDADCNTCGYTRAVTHTYTDEWSADGSTHWHGCTHCGAKKDESAHVFDNACDSSCNVCGYTRTIAHSYSDGWRTTDSSHWHECMVCGAKKDEASHKPGAAATDSTPQTCTVCGYVIEAALGHTHRYGEEWAKDYVSHWHACDCGAKKDEASHRWDIGKITKEPTTSATGARTYTCMVCGAKQIVVLDRLPAVTTTSPVTTAPTPVTTPDAGGEVTDAPTTEKPTPEPPTTDKPTTDAPATTVPATTVPTPESSTPDADSDAPIGQGNDDSPLLIVIAVLAVCLAGAVIAIVVLAKKKK